MNKEYEELRKSVIRLKEEHPDICMNRFEYRLIQYNESIEIASKILMRFGVSAAYASEKLREAFPMAISNLTGLFLFLLITSL